MAKVRIKREPAGKCKFCGWSLAWEIFGGKRTLVHVNKDRSYIYMGHKPKVKEV